MIRPYRISGTTTVTASDIAHVTVQKSGVIVGVKFIGSFASTASPASCYVELSSASAQNYTNDSVGPIDFVQWYQTVMTAVGVINQHINQYTALGGKGLLMKAFDRLYLHAAVTGVLTMTGNWMVYIEEG
jgi:hypothetical protein